ncbi:MAG: hypothetical protein WCV86_03930 [Patescibacteria group bacterium]|jgi:hypothetical protein
MNERGQNQESKPRRGFSIRMAIAAFVLVAILIGGVVFLFPRPVQAFPGEALAAAAWKEIRDSLRYLGQNLNTIRKDALKVTYDITYKNTLRLYLSRIAEDTAVWVASAGTGQEPLFITDPKYFQKLNDAAVGDFVARISTQTFGTDLSPLIGTQVFKDPKSLALVRRVVTTLTSPDKKTQSCNDFCIPTAEGSEQKLQAVRKWQSEGLEHLVPDDPKDLGPVVNCPVSIDDDDKYTLYWKDGEIDSRSIMEWPKIEARVCHGLLSSYIGQLKTEAQATFQACLNECKAFSGQRGKSAAETWTNLKAVDLGAAVESYYSLENNHFGVALSLYNEAAKAGREEEKALRDITPEGGLKPLVSPVSGAVLTPSVLTEERATQAVQESTSAEKIQTGSPWADALGVFSNTLVQKLTERFFAGKCGLNPKECAGPSGSPGTSDLGSLLFSGQRLTSIAAARLQFASLAQISYSVGSPSSDTYSSVDELTASGVLDAGFAQAIEQRFTVQEAINNGLLQGERTFGFDAQRNDPGSNGYGYRAMVYLRRARIIPVGWELAAQYIREYENSGNVLSLQRVVDAFFDCGIDGTDASPYCGLVDPNWVLKAPEQFCKRAGAGDEIISRDFVCDEDTNADGRINCSADPVFGGDLGRWVLQRDQNQCVDVQDCILENDDGTCIAFGYCFEEKPIWRFDGEACPSYYTSCQSYENTAGNISAYLADTVNIDSCTAENAGCQGYCAESSYWGSRDQWTCTADSGKIVYADDDIQSCNEQESGCNEYIRTTNGTNLVPNGSFEIYTGTIDDTTDDSFAGWSGAALAVSSTNTSFGADNVVVAEIAASGSLQARIQTGTPMAGRSFTVGLNTKGATGTCSGTLQVSSGLYSPPVVPVSFGSFWQQNASTFSVPNNASADTYVDIEIIPTGCAGQIDVAYLTLGDAFYNYTDYGTTNRIYLNAYGDNLLANSDFSYDAGKDFDPDWVGDNTTENDTVPDGWSGGGIDKLSGGYDDKTAVKLEGGGDQWTGQDIPVVQGKDYVVSGWVRSENAGGSGTVRTECVDANHNTLDDHTCELWSRTNNWNWEPQITNSEWTFVQYRIHANLSNVDFVRVFCYKYGGSGSLWCDNLRLEEVPESLLCNTEDVGCELYTAVEDGNEIPGIATSQDQCAEDQVGCKAYQEEGIDRIPIRDPADPVYLIAKTGQKCSAAAVGCEEYTNLNKLAEGGEALTYFTNARLCVPQDHSLVVANPTDHLFYSWVGTAEDGYQLRKWNLLKSNFDNGPCTNVSPGTVTTEPTCNDTLTTRAVCGPDAGNPTELFSNPDCVEFFDGNANPYYRYVSRTIPVSAECTPFRNTIDEAANKDIIYHILPSASRTCSAAQAFCREYKGSTGQNRVQVFYDDFEDGAADGWAPTIISFESLTGGGHSLSTGAGNTVTRLVSDIAQEGQSYLIRLWAKARGTGNPTDTIAAKFTNGTETDQATTSITPGEWNAYTIGPITIDHQVNPGEQFTLTLAGGGWVDNIEIIANVSSAYLIQGTADTCDEANVNCAAYRTRTNETVALKSFTRLCSEEQIGCEALIDTQNSESPFSQTVHGTTTPKDNAIAVINDPRRACSAQAAGCEPFGIASYVADGTVADFQTTYLVNEPDAHESILCDAAANFCREYNVPETGGVSYFKDPITRSCDYRVGQSYLGTDVTGWFKTDTNELCPSYNLWCKVGGTIQPANTPTQLDACLAVDKPFIYPTNGYSPLTKIFCTVDPGLDCSEALQAAACRTGGGSCVAPGLPSAVCDGGDDDGFACRTDADCTNGGACTDVYTGLCTTAFSGCNAYRDPLDPVGCQVECNNEIDASGNSVPVNASCEPDAAATTPGCTTYTYIRSSVEGRSADCNNQVDFERGCRPFYDSSNPSTLFNVVP